MPATRRRRRRRSCMTSRYTMMRTACRERQAALIPASSERSMLQAPAFRSRCHGRARLRKAPTGFRCSRRSIFRRNRSGPTNQARRSATKASGARVAAFGTSCTAWSAISHMRRSQQHSYRRRKSELSVPGRRLGRRERRLQRWRDLPRQHRRHRSDARRLRARPTRSTRPSAISSISATPSRTTPASSSTTTRSRTTSTACSLAHERRPFRRAATFQFNEIETVGQTNTYNSTWTAQDVPSGYTAEVESGGGNCADRIFADGFDDVCAGAARLAVHRHHGHRHAARPWRRRRDRRHDAVLVQFLRHHVEPDLRRQQRLRRCSTSPGASPLLFANRRCPRHRFPAPAIMPLWDDFDERIGRRLHRHARHDAEPPVHRRMVRSRALPGHFQYRRRDVRADPQRRTARSSSNTATSQYTGAQRSKIRRIAAAAPARRSACRAIWRLFNQFSAFENAVADNSGIAWTATSPQIFTSTDPRQPSTSARRRSSSIRIR